VSQKNIPNIFDCNLKTNDQILIIFDKNIPDTTCHQMTIQFSTLLKPLNKFASDLVVALASLNNTLSLEMEVLIPQES